VAELTRDAPLGATPLVDGTRFAAWSGAADRLEVCLFDDQGERRLPMERDTGGVWSAEVPGVGAGARYGFRAHGAWELSAGQRFNPAKLLVDPYARYLDGPIRLLDAHHDGVEPRAEDTAPITAKCVVAGALQPVDDAERPRTALSDSLIYEVHVRGATIAHPAVPAELRGTYAGLAAAPFVEHLQRLGVTALELLPVQQHVTRRWLLARGLTDYWGYNPIALRAPDVRFAAGADPRLELRAAVRSLHAVGIEVLLDVVFNHTGEGDHLGPTLSLRGLDNAAYYRLDAERPERYRDESGTGNALDTTHPAVIELALSALRSFVMEIGIDGFRFDLAASLARERDGEPISPAGAAPLLAAIAGDPVLAATKLIAEPWDVGAHGYRLGAFPRGWSEWNARFRDRARRCWVTGEQPAGELAAALSGSPDVFAARRGAEAALNYVTSHDGFTLRDLVSYRQRHNQANGEGERDGERANHSANFGVEGDTDEPDVLDTRARVRRALLASLLLSRGVPMLLGGDELGRTQAGNNNAYCHDSALSWLDWTGSDGAELVGLVATLATIRRRHPALRADGPTAWIALDGAAEEPGAALWLPDPEAEAGGSAGLLLLLNPGTAECRIRAPDGPGGWELVLESTAGALHASHEPEPSGGHPRGWVLGPHSLALLAPARQPSA